MRDRGFRNGASVAAGKRGSRLRSKHMTCFFRACTGPASRTCSAAASRSSARLCTPAMPPTHQARTANQILSICSAFIIYQDRLGSNTCQREMSNHVNMCPFRNTRAGYNVSLVRAALELMVEASTECSSQAFLYDLVDVAREWLSMSPCIDAWHKIDKSSSVSAAALTSQVRRSSFWIHFYTTTHDRFTKTGSGQPQEC